jgi:hypothetical protein
VFENEKGLEVRAEFLRDSAHCQEFRVTRPLLQLDDRASIDASKGSQLLLR